MMITKEFVKFLRNLDKNKNEKLKDILKLNRVGIDIATEYSTRLDLIDVEKAICLAKFKNAKVPKEEKHLLHFVPKYSPLLSLMEYYDNTPYLYSEINYLFKGCLKSGVEISIKGINLNSRYALLKQLDKISSNLGYYTLFSSWINQKYSATSVIEKLEKDCSEKYCLATEIKSTNILQEFFDIYKEEKILSKIKLPNIYGYLSSENLIVSEFIYGDYFYELLEKNKLSYDVVLELLKVQLFCILKIGIYHYNLHSGNLLLSEKGNIHFLDCNSIAVLNHKNRDNLFDLIYNILYKNNDEIEKALKKLAGEKCEIIPKLHYAIKTIINGKDNPFLKIMKIIRLSCINGFSFETEVFGVVKTLIYFNFIAEKLKLNDEKFEKDCCEVMEKIKPYMLNTLHS